MNEPARNGEHSAWRLLRLWPVALLFLAVMGNYFTVSAGQKTIKDKQLRQEKKIDGNIENINILKGQAIRVEEQLKQVNDKLTSQKDDIKVILRIIQQPRN